MREQWSYWLILVCFNQLFHTPPKRRHTILNSFLQFLCPILALATCFGTIHSSITYKAPTQLVQLDLAHMNHPDVLVLLRDGDPMHHQSALESVVENYNSTVKSLRPSDRTLKNGTLFVLSLCEFRHALNVAEEICFTFLQSCCPSRWLILPTTMRDWFVLLQWNSIRARACTPWTFCIPEIFSTVRPLRSIWFRIWFSSNNPMESTRFTSTTIRWWGEIRLAYSHIVCTEI